MSDVLDFLLPKPRFARLHGTLRVAPREIEILCPPESPAHAAAQDLADWIRNAAGDTPLLRHTADNDLAAVRIAIGGEENPATAAAVAGGVFRPEFPEPGAQAYAIGHSGRSLFLAGREFEGTFYATRTLKQALRADGDAVLLPLLEVRDAADMAERGFWDYFYPATLRPNSELHTFHTAGQWCALIDDLSDYKMNLAELLLTDSGLLYASPRFPELQQDGVPPNMNARVRRVIEHARRRAFRVLPATVHPEQMHRLRERYPETRAVRPEGCQPSIREHMLCFSHPVTRNLLGGIIEEIADLFGPDGVCVWAPEHLGHCTCQNCRDRWGYQAAFLSICQTAFDNARKRHARFRPRILASFLRYADEMARLFPGQTDLVYYECDRHGTYGFDSPKLLPARVAGMARERGVLGCLSFRGAGLKYAPLPVIDNVRDWVRTFRAAGARGITGSIYSNPGVCRLNLLAMADAAWNGPGHDIDSFLYAFCGRHALSRPRMRARVLKRLSQAWEVWHRHHGKLCMLHALGRIVECRPHDYLDAALVTDSLEFRILPDFEAARTGLIECRPYLAQVQDPQLEACVDFADGVLDAARHILAALHVYGRQQWPDPEKGPWTDWIEEIRCHAREALDALHGASEQSRRLRSTYADVKGDPAVPFDDVVSLLERILAPPCGERLRKATWPDLPSFA